MKLGFIARADNSGLGSMSWEFTEHMKPEKVLIVENGAYRTFPERFSEFKTKVVHRADILKETEWLLDGIDVLFTIETPYDPQVLTMAKRRGIKTVLMPMYESLPVKNEWAVDLWLCPSLLDYDVCFEPKKLLEFPVNTRRIKFRQRKKAKVFVHNAGHGGLAGRNGTDELVRAIPLVESDIRFLIRSQVPLELPYEDDRVKVIVGNIERYWALWGEGDVFVFPEKFNGVSLPINEALASGMVVMSSDRYPFNQWIPKEPLIPVKRTVRATVATRPLDYARIQPEDIAAKIDEIAHKDISMLSKLSYETAKRISWDSMLPEYKKIFNEIA